MIKVLFICHGNICRSPMAEFIFRYLAKSAGKKEYEVSSRATSAEELGNPIHPGARRKLSAEKIPFFERSAVRVTKEDCDNNDIILCMDRKNISNMAPFIGQNSAKLHLLSEFSGTVKDVSDPWYTGNFDEPFDDIKKGCIGLLSYLEK